MLWRILGNEHDVCDAYQQTFLNLAHYEQAGKTRPRNVQAYVFRTATNTAISILRRKQRGRRHLDTMAATKPLQQNTGPADDLDAKLLQDKLRAIDIYYRRKGAYAPEKTQEVSDPISESIRILEERRRSAGRETY